MTAKRTLSMTLGAVVALIASEWFSGAALAQSQYPTGAGRSAGLGTYGIVRDKPEKDPDSEASKQARAKRACLVGKNSVMLVDADSAAARQRDCYDVDDGVHDASGDSARSGTRELFPETGPKSR